MQLPQRSDQQETGQPFERASLQELRVRRASPIPDARDAYDELKHRVLHLLAEDGGDNPTEKENDRSRAAIQAKLETVLAEEHIILKQHEKRRLTQDVISELMKTEASSSVIAAEDAALNFLSIQELVEAQMLSGEAANYLQTAVQERVNILISGEAGTGKTTLLRALCSFIPAEEQIVTIEERAELHLDNQQVIALEIQATTHSQKPEISAETLIMTSMQMRPDRLILGSLVGTEAYTWLQVINGGLRGSMTTCVGSDPLNVLAQIETMASPDNPALALEDIRRDLGSAIDLIVHIERQKPDGRRAAAIRKLAGYEDNQFVTIDIY